MSRTERDAKLLGYAGLIPFAFGAMVAWVPLLPLPLAIGYVGWVQLYAAIILSFMGGARWSLAMSADRDGRILSGLAVAVSPALLAWVAVVPERILPLAFPAPTRLCFLALGFALLLAADLRGVRAGEAPSWYGVLRTRLTVGVIACLVVIALRPLA